MPAESLCRHQIGPIYVGHRHGYVVAECLRCGFVLSSWIGNVWETEAIELRGVMTEVKDHLHRDHGADYCDGCEALRTCAWDTIKRGAFVGV